MRYLRVVKLIETESKMVREGRMGSWCLMGTEFQFKTMIRFCG